METSNIISFYEKKKKTYTEWLDPEWLEDAILG